MSEPEDAEAMWLEADALWDAGDEAGAFALFSRAAALGNISAYCSVGLFYGGGIGVAKNVRLEMRWYQRAWAHNRDATASNNIAVVHAQAGNRRLAEFWWRKELARGDGEAALELARLLLQSRRPRDIARAKLLLHFALARGTRQRMSQAGEEEARHLLLQLRRSRRVALRDVARGWRAQSRR